MTDVFFSHAREDRASVSALASVFRDQGWSVWWDDLIPAGVSWREAIEQALLEARCTVVLWSRHSVRSAWVRAEAGQSMDRGILVPVQLEAVTPPLPFATLETAQLSGWPDAADAAQLDNLVSSVRATLAGERGGGSWARHAPGPDPTISVRVAKRVVSQIREESAALVLERAISDFLLAGLAGVSALQRLEKLVRGAAQAAEAPVAGFALGGLRTSVLGTPSDAQLDQLVAAGAHAGGQVGTGFRSDGLAVDWCLLVGPPAGTHVWLAGVRGPTMPSAVLLARLSELAPALAVLEA